jgi:[acyl-carrier-protein] S-malonyltransferase
MSRLALIFPGQGAQYQGMGKAMHDAFPVAQQVFDQATQGLGRDARQLCWQTEAAALSDTVNAQPGILAASMACLAPLLEAGARPTALAGLSLGEYTALVGAGSVKLADAMQLVQLRAQLMQAAVPKGEGAMAAVIGLERASVEMACASASALGVVEPANYNAPDQIVISGHARAVAAAGEAAKAAGAKRVIPLAVSAPFHCSLLRSVEPVFGAALDAVEFGPPAIPVIANATAGLVETPGQIRGALVAQVSSPVLWEDSVRYLVDKLGIDTFVEVGPGKALSRFVNRIEPSATMLNVEDPASMASALCELRSRGLAG